MIMKVKRIHESLTIGQFFHRSRKERKENAMNRKENNTSCHFDDPREEKSLKRSGDFSLSLEMTKHMASFALSWRSSRERSGMISPFPRVVIHESFFSQATDEKSIQPAQTVQIIRKQA